MPIDFAQMKDAREFEQAALPHLLAASQHFFDCEITYIAAPLKWLVERHEIDINSNPRRGVYRVGPTTVIVLGRVLQEKTVHATFALKLEHVQLEGLMSFLNVFESALALTLSRSSVFRFRDKPQNYGEHLISLAIAKYFAKGYYDYRQVLYLTDTFQKLASTTFEGRHFTTGLVLTRSYYAFAGKGGESRDGSLFPLSQPNRLVPTDGIDKRFWYLADGQTSYFLSDQHLRIRDLLVLSGGRPGVASFVDAYSLVKTVRGGDALFRVSSNSEFSIAGSGGIDFNFREGRWRVRDLRGVAAFIQTTLNVNEQFVQGLLYYAFYLSRRRLGSILWVPLDMDRVDETLISKNRLTKEPMSIVESSHSQTLIRLLSSDGASVIDRSGSIHSFGSIVDISKVRIAGVKGTGESVTSLLGRNGIAIKVSQDGNIKLYHGEDRPLLL